MRACVRVRVGVRACVRACVCVWARACVSPRAGWIGKSIDGNLDMQMEDGGWRMEDGGRMISDMGIWMGCVRQPPAHAKDIMDNRGVICMIYKIIQKNCTGEFITHFLSLSMHTTYYP